MAIENTNNYGVNTTIWEPHAPVISEFQSGDLLKCIDLQGNKVLCTIVEVNKKYTEDNKLISIKIKVMPCTFTMEDLLTRDELLDLEPVYFRTNKFFSYPVWNININEPEEN